ncbi:26s proteasome non-atpase regulatory subunit 7 [Anaeramoeba ignava]|uniref:26s proteasome non-atpase regulatory subunit 7 n=1 Tax=Anaeramoeba ignava TaxID=1746090 RepID=A0A9Q0LTT4_ANAIG|nr:26s proteasome non-atpase regulatory subunit 7 [Anaeramoeba ignava]
MENKNKITQKTSQLNYTKKKTIIIHPLVILTIIEDYMRRSNSEAIGVLLGFKRKNLSENQENLIENFNSQNLSITEITNCIPIPYKNDEKTKELLEHREKLFQKNRKKEEKQNENSNQNSNQNSNENSNENLNQEKNIENNKDKQDQEKSSQNITKTNQDLESDYIRSKNYQIKSLLEMLKFHKETFKNEKILGWYSTTPSPILIKDFLDNNSLKSNNPITLTLNTKKFTKENNPQIKVFQVEVIQFANEILGTYFNLIPHYFSSLNHQRNALSMLISDQNEHGVENIVKSTPKKQLEIMVKNLQKKIDKIQNQVNNLDVTILDELKLNQMKNKFKYSFMEIIEFEKKHLMEKEIERVLSDDIEDSLMLTYLSQLIESQTILIEKLSGL